MLNDKTLLPTRGTQHASVSQLCYFVCQGAHFFFQCGERCAQLPSPRRIAPDCVCKHKAQRCHVNFARPASQFDYCCNQVGLTFISTATVLSSARQAQYATTFQFQRIEYSCGITHGARQDTHFAQVQHRLSQTQQQRDRPRVSADALPASKCRQHGGRFIQCGACM